MDLLQTSKVVLRPWRVADAEFCLVVRNHPDLMRWFRQDEPITLEQQIDFIQSDLSEYGAYNGLVIEVDGISAGLCSVKDTDEFTIGLLPEYQHKGIATRVMQMLINRGWNIWSEVFVGNPALEWFISKCGFKVVSVRERAYYKKGLGLVDVVGIRHG